MPALGDYNDDGRFDFEDVRSSVHDTWEGFVDFAFRDNVLEVGLGLIFASCFTAVANSLVSDLVLPIISLLPFLSRNIEEKFIILRGGKAHPERYNTVRQALDDGALVWAYGSFLDKVFRFLVIAVSLYLIARIYSWITRDNIVKKQVRCRFCRKYISEKAKRCFNCTSWQDGREDKGQIDQSQTDE